MPPVPDDPHTGALRVPVPRPLHEPSASRLGSDHPSRAEILRRHARALAADEPGYEDPDTGLFVLTAAYLADRGACCGSGCRHCPYCP